MTQIDDQVERWRAEFEKMIGEDLTKKNGPPFKITGFSHLAPREGSYKLNTIEAMWQGFLMAKQSMPTINLPKSSWIESMSTDVFWKGEIEKALESSGYTYSQE